MNLSPLDRLKAQRFIQRIRAQSYRIWLHQDGTIRVGPTPIPDWVAGEIKAIKPALLVLLEKDSDAPSSAWSESAARQMCDRLVSKMDGIGNGSTDEFKIRRHRLMDEIQEAFSSKNMDLLQTRTAALLAALHEEEQAS